MGNFISTTNKLQRTFKILITNKYNIQSFLIDSQGNETLIEIKEENINNILKDLFQNPNEYKTFPFEYVNKQYELINEVFIALVLYQYKKKIDQSFVITKTILLLPFDNKIIRNRISIALQSIGLKDIEIDESLIQFDYTKQGEYLEEIIKIKEEYERYQQMIENNSKRRK